MGAEDEETELEDRGARGSVVRTEIVWLDNSRRKGRPIRRRWCLYVGERRVLAVPLTPVAWSR